MDCRRRWVASRRLACARWLDEKSMLETLRRHLQRHLPYLYLRECMRALQGVGKHLHGGVISLEPPAGISRGNVLISYDSRGLQQLKRGEAISTSHPQYFKTVVMARTFLDLGFR